MASFFPVAGAAAVDGVDHMSVLSFCESDIVKSKGCALDIGQILLLNWC